MICKIKGRLSQKNQQSVVVEKEGIFYQIETPLTVSHRLKEVGQTIELIIYHYFNLTKNKGIPVLIGFTDELEKEFFEKFISISGVGPKAALRAFDKPIPLIAKAIEEADMNFLTDLAGVGKQRARQIIAHLQGKVGRFALIKEELEEKKQKESAKKEIVQEAKQILKRLQYKSQEIDKMIQKALAANSEIETVENLLNEIYKQKKKVAS
ncbi:MAG: Holliday junction branch migration protein RuvA [Candidatus Omnitrophota bacterium]